jgi:ADP-ribosylglycohydrolase
MLGAITGDIVAAPWEGGRCDREHFELFSTNACITDDTVCTIAIADALLNGKDYARTMRQWVIANPGRGYGSLFRSWALSLDGPYNSFGNGGAMRVSPVGLLARSLEEAEHLAATTAAISHNHPDGIKGAQAIAVALWLTLRQEEPGTIRREITQRYGYDLTPTVAELEQAALPFSTSAEDTVPAALICALEANSWQEAVTHAVAIGGDSDTLACMAGGIAEARYGIPLPIAQQAMEYLPREMVPVITQLYQTAGKPLPWMEETSRPLVPDFNGPEVLREPDAHPASWFDRLFGAGKRHR